jgi:hypothetical protein
MALVRLRNINPLGQVDLPLIRRQGDDYLGEEGIGNLEPGEEFDVASEHAAILLQQSGNYEPVDAAAIAIDSKIPHNAFRHQKKPAKQQAPRKPRASTSKPKPAAEAAAAVTTEKGAE